jgi:K+-sensing histidine kinase KdpD
VRPAGREALDDAQRVLPFELLGEPQFVCIEIEYEGIGMSPDVLAHVFERYHTDGRDPASTGGAHLGLHISRSLVEAQDGSLRMEATWRGNHRKVTRATAATARFRRLRRRRRVKHLRAARRPASR